MDQQDQQYRVKYRMKSEHGNELPGHMFLSTWAKVERNIKSLRRDGAYRFVIDKVTIPKTVYDKQRVLHKCAVPEG